MDVIARYVADQTENGDPMVLDLSRDPAHVACVCRTDADAEMIVRALNNSWGAVEALRRIEAGEPLKRYEWCRAVARSALAGIDGPPDQQQPAHPAAEPPENAGSRSGPSRMGRIVGGTSTTHKGGTQS